MTSDTKLNTTDIRKYNIDLEQTGLNLPKMRLSGSDLDGTSPSAVFSKVATANTL
jgi:hypothetical protein